MMKVLLIDDNPIDLMIHEKLVNRALGSDAEVVRLKSGRDAISYLENNNAANSLILLDIKMPIMDGFEFLDEAVKLKLLEGAVVYMLSSSIDPKDLQMADESEYIAGFLQKPLSLDTLNQLEIGAS